MLIYGFPSTGKSWLATRFNLFDTDTLLGVLDSSSDRALKAKVSEAAHLLRNNGFSGVTNLLDLKPDYVFYRTNANRVREIMIERGDDEELVNSLNIEGWIQGLERRLESDWKGCHVIRLNDDEYIGDFSYTLDLVELSELGV